MVSPNLPPLQVFAFGLRSAEVRAAVGCCLHEAHWLSFYLNDIE
jgi:hypothetical protein